jgi:hypothetical protein
MLSPPAPSPSVPSRVDLDPGSAGCDREDRRGGVVAAVPDRPDASSQPAGRPRRGSFDAPAGYEATAGAGRRRGPRSKAPNRAATSLCSERERSASRPLSGSDRNGPQRKRDAPPRSDRGRRGRRPGRPASRLELGDPAPPTFLGTNYVRIYIELVAVDCSGRSPLDASVGRRRRSSAGIRTHARPPARTPVGARRRPVAPPSAALGKLLSGGVDPAPLALRDRPRGKRRAG